MVLVGAIRLIQLLQRLQLANARFAHHVVVANDLDGDDGTVSRRIGGTHHVAEDAGAGVPVF